VEGGVAALRAKTKAWGGTITSNERDVKREDLAAIAESAHGTGMTGSIRKLGLEDIRKIVENAYE
jgi:hypothetical protein